MNYLFKFGLGLGLQSEEKLNRWGLWGGGIKGYGEFTGIKKKREAEAGLCCHGTSRKGPSPPDGKSRWDLSLGAHDGIWPPDLNMQFHSTEGKKKHIKETRTNKSKDEWKKKKKRS